MKVLMTADTVGGVWAYSLELADSLAPHGVEVVLATMGRRLTPDQWSQVEASGVVEVRESGFALEWMPDPWPDVDAAGRWLLDLEAEVGPDLVHLNGYVHAAMPWRAPTVVVAHSDVASWWQAVHGVPAPSSWDMYRRRVADGLAAADEVVAPTAAVLDDIHRAYGIAGGSVVPNGRRDDWLAPPAKEPVVFTAGRLWDDAKNVAAVVAAAPDLEWPVAIAGEAVVPPQAARSGSLGVVGWLGVLGPEEMASWMGRASIFALPARYEPFGLAALEAGLAGCALVLGDIPSLREVWGDAAVFVDPHDHDEVASALRRLIADPPAVADLGTRAAERARTYTPQRMARGYLDVYGRLPARART